MVRGITPPRAREGRLMPRGQRPMSSSTKGTRGALAAALAAALLSGCGTIFNFASGDPELYGGVQNDLTFIQKPKETGPGVGSGKAAFLLLPVELTLSLVADTLTLPLAVYLRQRDYAVDDQAVPAGGSPLVNPEVRAAVLEYFGGN